MSYQPTHSKNHRRAQGDSESYQQQLKQLRCEIEEEKDHTKKHRLEIKETEMKHEYKYQNPSYYNHNYDQSWNTNYDLHQNHKNGHKQYYSFEPLDLGFDTIQIKETQHHFAAPNTPSSNSEDEEINNNKHSFEKLENESLDLGFDKAHDPHLKWKNYCSEAAEEPNTPSSGSDEDEINHAYDNFDYDYECMQDEIKINEPFLSSQMDANHKHNKDDDITHDAQLTLWMKRINGLHIRPPPCGYSHNKSIEVYNQLTGGKCYEIEQQIIHKTAYQNQTNKSGEFQSYIHHIHKHIFHINDTTFYENMLMFLDAKSIFNGFMITCKKLHYFKFVDECKIWHELLMRDYPRLFNHEMYRLLVPYTGIHSNDNSFKQVILSRRQETNLYFTKIQHDKWWKLLYNLKGLKPNVSAMNNEYIETKWKSFKWSELLLGKDDDNGLNAYKQLSKLRYNPYVTEFGDTQLADDEQIEYFCNIMRKHMPSAKAIVYLNPWIPLHKYIPWNKTSGSNITWRDKYAQCYALTELDDDYRLEKLKIPTFIQLIGTMQFNKGKGSVPKPDWLAFLQTFDRNVSCISEVKSGWFQKQFMLIEMEARIKNIRTFIEIVRS